VNRIWIALVFGSTVALGVGALPPEAGVTTGPTSVPATQPAATQASSQNATTTIAPAAVAPEALALLKMLQARDETLKDFSARVKSEAYDVRLDETQSETGTLAYVRSGTNRKFALRLDGFLVDGQPQGKRDRAVAFDGRWLVDQDNLRKQYTKTEVVPPDQVVNPMRVGGPLPIPLGQDPDEILRDFTVTVDAAGGAAMKWERPLQKLDLVPLVPESFRLRKLEMWIDAELQLPVRLRVTALDKKATLWALDKVVVNTGKVAWVDMPVPEGKEWTVTIQPMGKREEVGGKR